MTTQKLVDINLVKTSGPTTVTEVNKVMEIIRERGLDHIPVDYKYQVALTEDNPHGNTYLEAARELGYRTVPVSIVEESIETLSREILDSIAEDFQDTEVLDIGYIKLGARKDNSLELKLMRDDKPSITYTLTITQN